MHALAEASRYQVTVLNARSISGQLKGKLEPRHTKAWSLLVGRQYLLGLIHSNGRIEPFEVSSKYRLEYI